MAATMVPLQSITLTGSAASVTFSGIPQTYTDLVLRMSIRTTAAAVYDVALLRFNGTSSGYTATWLSANGSTATSSRLTGGTYMYAFNVTGANATANTFGSLEMYVPNYTASQNKPMGNTGVSETNATGAQMGALAGLWSNTAAITDISVHGSSLAAGSTFHLYGIKATA